ncbi:MAG: 3-beta hydroxysteroid dehydrogenase [Chthoniobacteraceae bacterium]|nr:3-beta hydroxysteroid dehydrogenase [Chthoniobacteraceae bacterium]
MNRILITGGAGFAGSTIARALRDRNPDSEIVQADNLGRRGSELTLPGLAAAGIRFLHGDVRNPHDFPQDFKADVLVECSAEPSVMAGYSSAPNYLLETNLSGAINCLEYCRKHQSQIIFLSTSRVYSTRALCSARIVETSTRFTFAEEQVLPGCSPEGISADFPTTGPRSLYGTTKLAAELLIEEYGHAYGIHTVINRCGVLAGPWQMAHPDQGIFTFWLWRHLQGKPLTYIGFDGTGRQTRDLLDARDLATLLDLQIKEPEVWNGWNGWNGNVGGGRQISLSLQETTALCRELTGNVVPIAADLNPRLMDIPIYLSDCAQLYARTS